MLDVVAKQRRAERASEVVATFAPIQARAAENPIGFASRGQTAEHTGIHTDGLEAFYPLGRKHSSVRSQFDMPSSDHAIGNPHRNLASQMVVVTAREAPSQSLPSLLEPLTSKQLWRDRAFFTLALGMAIGLFAQIGLLAHLFKLLVPTLGAHAAGCLMGGGTACAIIGRMVAARAMGYVEDRRTIAAGSYFMQAVGSAVLLFAPAGSIWPLVLGVALLGAGIGNATFLPPLIAQTDFASQDVPRVVALIVAISQGTYAFAPAVFGMLQQSGGGVSVGVGHQAGGIFVTAMVIQLAAAAVFLVGRRRVRGRAQ